jgi:hypothetical protein
MQWPDKASMIYPKTIKISENHAVGDMALRHVSHPAVKGIDRGQFVEKRYRRAIGGVQIVQGDVARLGYLADSVRFQKPADLPFGDFRDDLAYRAECSKHGMIVGVDLPGVYRIRHGSTSYQTTNANQQ